MTYKLTNSGLKGVPKHGNKSLNFFTFFEVQIAPLDENEAPTNQSIVVFRFHSSKAFCEMTKDALVKVHGAIHARYFVYEGTDKTEEQLIEWALTTEGLIANDEVTTIYEAKEI